MMLLVTNMFNRHVVNKMVMVPLEKIMLENTFLNPILRKKQRANAALPATLSALALSACGSSGADEEEVVTGSVPVADFTHVGTASNESIIGTSDRDIIDGLEGDDYIRALAGDDVIYAGKGNDSLWGDDGDDQLFGGDGNDTIRAGDGDDKSYGGSGDDVIYLSSGSDFEDGGEGNDTIKIQSGNSTTPITFDLLIGQYYYTAQGGGSLINLVSIENIDSSATADTTVKDTPSANIMNTAGGNDFIYSVGGDDVISTGSGDDFVSLTAGDYTVDLGSGDDVVVLPFSPSLIDGGSGSDTVMAREIDGFESVYINLENEFYFIESLGAAQDGIDKSLENFENVTIAGVVDTTIFGTNEDNVISAADGVDTISAGAGDDTVSGGNADDTIDAGAGSDTISGGTGDDTFTQSLGHSTAATAQTIAAAGTIAAADTITFGNGLDVYTDFVAGNASESIDTDNSGSTLTSVIGQDEAALTDNVLSFASGNYDAATGVFTITANGVGADTLIIDVDNANNDASDVLSTSSSMFLLQGVDSDALVAGDFV